MLIQQQQFQPAEELLEKALKSHEKILGTDHVRVINDLFQLGILFHGKEKFIYAEGLYRKCSELCQHLWTKHSTKGQPPSKEVQLLLEKILKSYAFLLKGRGRLSEAVLAEERAVAVSKGKLYATEEENE